MQQYSQGPQIPLYTRPTVSAEVIYGSIKPVRPPAYSRFDFERHVIDGKWHVET